MRESKHIDRLFQENLKDYEALPPGKCWGAIEQKLKVTPRKRRIPIWVKISSIAALMLLFFSIGTIYFIPQNEFASTFLKKYLTTETTEDQTEPIEPNVIVPKIDSQEKDNHVKSKVIQLMPNSTIGEATDLLVDKSDSNETNVEPKSPNSYRLTDTKNLPLQKSTEIQVSTKGFNPNKFTVATIFAPIYFNSFGSGSGIDAQFGDRKSSGSASYSYGVKFAYQLNRKLSVQSGVNMINLGRQTNDVYVTPGVAVLSFSNLSNRPFRAKNSVQSVKAGIQDNSAASLNQVFGYIEIPVEVKYNLSNGKIGVYVVGGFSTLLLNNDEVFIETNSFTQSLGASNNLKPLNFSGNVGIDIDYLINKNLFINISPMFKMQTNTFSKNSGSIQPYYLGVYTGLNYKF